MTGPLSGVRITDLTTVVMGPLATRILGDLGADVIKVESPAGDGPRHFEPSRHAGMSGFWLNLNRSKRSVVLDLKRPKGRDALIDLVASSDVFVTNVRSRALASMRLTYADLAAGRDDLIYCAAQGFGSAGPSAHKPAYDDVIQAVSGLASLFERVGGEPAFVPGIVGDKVASLHVTYAVLAALYRRATTGLGDYIEVPMAESLASFNLVEQINGHAFDPPMGEFGYPRLMSRARRPRRCRDGWLCILPYSDANWRDFFELSGRVDLASDPRFATFNLRVEHVDELYAMLDEVLPTRTVAEWIEACDARSIPAASVVDLEHIADDAHFAAVHLLEVREHATEGKYRQIKDPVTFASAPDRVFLDAPQLGQHTVAVLRELGYQDDEITQATGIVPRGRP